MPLTFPPSQSNVSIQLAQNHFPPTLSGGAVSPASGGVGGQEFAFTVTYTSAENTPPGDMYVVIDSWPWPMEPVDPSDTNYADGAAFRYRTTLTTGTHSFWFGALDEAMLEARHPASGNLSVTAVASGVITGTVKDSVTSAAIAGATVRAYLGAVLKGTATTNASGVYRISSGLGAGTYTVIAAKTGYVTLAKSAAVTAGATSYASFFLVPSGTLTGTVKVLGTNAPIAGATVKAYLSGVLKATATTNADGVYRIADALAAGTYSVTCAKTGYVTQTKSGIVVTAGAVSYASFFLVAVS